jgi:hypothetical protein
MLSLAASRLKKPNARLPEPNIRLVLGETAGKAVSFLHGFAVHVRTASSASKRVGCPISLAKPFDVAVIMFMRNAFSDCYRGPPRFGVGAGQP